MSDDERPALRVVRGEPDAVDLAVLTALLSARFGSAGGADERGGRGGWRDPARGFGRMPIPGPNAWRTSGW